MTITVNYPLTKDEVIRQMYNYQLDYNTNAVQDYDAFASVVTKEDIFMWLRSYEVAHSVDVID